LCFRGTIENVKNTFVQLGISSIGVATDKKSSSILLY
jgi:hypothetical protein